MINKNGYIQQESGIGIEKVVSVADDIMNLSPEMSWANLLDLICEKTAFLTNVSAATCRTLDPGKQRMFADGKFNFDVNRIAEIPPEHIPPF